jgi:hypothetical protein
MADVWGSCGICLGSTGVGKAGMIFPISIPGLDGKIVLVDLFHRLDRDYSPKDRASCSSRNMDVFLV